MADQRKKVDANVPGNVFVDRTCINCDACRQLAPESFSEVGDYSAVVHQPESPRQVKEAYQALLACPVGSIGVARNEPVHLQAAKSSFPLPLEEAVFYCGFNSAQSYGANSFFIRHPDGNWLIDSPRYLRHLVDAFDRMGGLAFIFLTHEDDVADADRYAEQFGAKRIIHRADAHAVPDAEWVLDGGEAVLLAPDVRAIPVPGHTPGSQALLYRDEYLFTGDHLWWEPDHNALAAPRQLVWDHDELLRSIETLLRYRFRWVLAGHGGRICLSVDDMQIQLRQLLERRKALLVS
jgi:glyoxylase-like metal-dependent hydrolase (beta-lactamase superfamily II)/ferredoxin